MENAPVKELKNYFPNRTYDALKLRAEKLGLIFWDKTTKHPSVVGDLSKLLEETPVAYYWVGFLMADGYINHETMRLNFTLAKTDKNQIIKFANHIGCNFKDVKGKNACKTAIQDKCNMPKIISKFDFKPQKTYNPPDLTKINKNLFDYFLIGFIDGDGSIRKQYKRKDSVIKIKVHSTWLNNLQFISEHLSKKYNVRLVYPKINNQGYAKFDISNMISVRNLKILSKNVPCIERKWEIIDEKLMITLSKLFGYWEVLHHAGYMNISPTDEQSMNWIKYF
jgi:hypothetical protein